MEKTYLFDFDGTLVDSMPTYAGVMLEILDERAIPYPDDFVKTITPLGFVGTAKLFIEMGVKMGEQELVALMVARMYDKYAHDIPAKEGAVEALTELKRRGCGLNVLTASPHDTLDVCLKRLGLYDLFDNVWSCNDFGTTKADPEIYRLSAERIGKSVSEIIFLDDNLGADLTAKSAGMVVYGVFDESSKDFEEQMRASTDAYVRDLRELL